MSDNTELNSEIADEILFVVQLTLFPDAPKDRDRRERPQINAYEEIETRRFVRWRIS